MIAVEDVDKMLSYENQEVSQTCSQIIVGDSRERIKVLPDNFYSSCITSPPYWGMRDYGVQDQIGAETNLNDYINNLVAIFRDIKTKLKEDGTLWLNLGDSYTSGNRAWRAPDKKKLPEKCLTDLLLQKV